VFLKMFDSVNHLRQLTKVRLREKASQQHVKR
jgi:hypothetical protein